MIEPERGFAIDDAAYRWGTTPGDMPHNGPRPISTDYLHLDVACRTVMGFQAAGVTLSAPASDRPMMNVAYALAPPPAGRDGPAYWTDGLRQRFGQPDQQAGQDGHGGFNVAYWAIWSRPTIDIGLSIHGDVRRSTVGRSAGLLCVRWRDTAAAAAPYVAQWRMATAALIQSAVTLAAFRRFDMPRALAPAGDPLDPYPASFEDWRALNRRTLLGTPASIGERLSAGSFALWQSGVDGIWALSTTWDTVVLRSTSRVCWTELRPAKGGGQSGLSADGLSIVMPYGTKAIAAAAAALKALPGLKVAAVQDDDV